MNFFISLFFLISIAFGQNFKPLDVKDVNVYLNPFLNDSDYPELNSQSAIHDWAWIRVEDNEEGVKKIIPPETGRAFMVPTSGGKLQILVKGTGPNPEWIGDRNKIRYSVNGEALGFNGKFKNLESLHDIYNSEVLRSLGVDVARPLGFINLGLDKELKTEIGVYARSFIAQTRLSNLWALTKEDALKVIDETITQLHELKITKKRLTRAQYFFWLSDKLAKSVAIMQASGFQHGVLHSQQITLAGELTDMGTGVWSHDPDFNASFRQLDLPYFKFENQPLLIQNMLVRGHSVTASTPVPLTKDSETLKLHKKSLLGFFIEADPDTAFEIQNLNPFSRFWDVFENAYQSFEPRSLPKLSDFFKYTKIGDERLNWPGHYLKLDDKIPDLPVGIWSSNGKFKKRNYFYDDLILKSGIQSKYSVTNLSPGIKYNFTRASLDETYWKVHLDLESPEIKKFLQNFNEKLKSISAEFQDLGKPDATAAVLRLIRDQSTLDFGPAKKNEDLISYKKMADRRWNGDGINLSEVLNCKVGICTDSSILALLLGKEVEKKDSRFIFNIEKSVHSQDWKHFYVLVKAPNKRVYVVDGIEKNFVGRLGLYEELLNPTLNEVASAYKNPTLVISSNLQDSCNRFFQSLIGQFGF